MEQVVKVCSEKIEESSCYMHVAAAIPSIAIFLKRDRYLIFKIQFLVIETLGAALIQPEYSFSVSTVIIRYTAL